MYMYVYIYTCKYTQFYIIIHTWFNGESGKLIVNPGGQSARTPAITHLQQAGISVLLLSIVDDIPISDCWLDLEYLNEIPSGQIRIIH